MPLTANEITPCCIAYIDPAILVADESVTITGRKRRLPDGSVNVSPTTRTGPFICTALDGQTCTWTPVTTQFREERVRLKAEWIRNGYGSLGIGSNYLLDGAHSFQGPVEAFVRAGSQEAPFETGQRPVLTAEGLAAIHDEMKRQAHRAKVFSRPKSPSGLSPKLTNGDALGSLSAVQ